MSKRFLKAAMYSVHKLFDDATELSFKTRYDYEKGMKLAVTQLHEAGIQLSHIRHLKERHIQTLTRLWQSQSLKPATIKNRLSQLRYVCRNIGKSNIMPADNDQLGIAKRTYLPERNKAIYNFDASRFTVPYIKLSVQLQQHFGLRREESMKFIASKADKGTHIELQASWTKGGIARMVPITTQKQRDLLDQIKSSIPMGHSLIPKDKSYRQQEHTYVAQVRAAGYRNLHGLRHAYAQQRYKMLTNELSNGKGWESPINNGLQSGNMTSMQRGIDYQTRMKISEELGHSRLAILKIYLN
ncbi:MAG: phage integrase N-terminal domain-containing protein [Gammaproteobacteria bacterium]